MVFPVEVPNVKGHRRLLTRWLSVLACACSVLPYLLIAKGGNWNIELLAFTGSGIWVGLVILTQISGGWARKLRWLWLLFPVAFGPQLYVLLMVVVLSFTGFAP